MSYFEDIKYNIRIHAERLITQALATNDEQAIAWAKVRRRSLAKFLKGRNPMSYHVSVYPDLIRAVNPPGAHLSLQTGDTQSMSTLELASLMYNMTKPINPSALQAPFFPKSACVGVFRVAVAFIERQASLGQMGDAGVFVKSIFAMIFDEKQIAHVPWSAPIAPHTIGRPSRRVVFDFFRSTSKLQERGERAMMHVVSAEEQALMADTRLAESAALSDANSPWCINPLTIGDLPSIMHKQTLPSDFKIEHASLGACDAYVTSTYDWVVKEYDGARPLHKFALLVGHMFSRIAPLLSHPAPPSNLRQIPVGDNSMTLHIRAVPWIKSATRGEKGLTATLPFIVMVTTTIIALADEKSPLRQYMGAHEGSLGIWTRKHGEPLVVISIPMRTPSDNACHREERYQCLQPCASRCCLRT